MSEKVLCVRERDLAELLEPLDVSTNFGSIIFADWLTRHQWATLSAPYRFVSRDKCEYDDRLKQIIPYVVVKNGDRYLSYSRTSKSGEKRLVGRKSIGLGGHINLSDLQFINQPNLNRILHVCACREIKEELGVILPPSVFTFKCMLYMPTDDVSRKHFGIVASVSLSPEKIVQPENTMIKLEWHTAPELLKDRLSYETWSQFLISFSIQRSEL